jgi:hypothetical protein
MLQSFLTDFVSEEWNSEVIARPGFEIAIPREYATKAIKNLGDHVCVTRAAD